MKKIKTSLIYFLAVFASLAIISCSDDDSDSNGPQGPQPTANSKTYDLGPIADPTISGTITFTELDDNSIRAEIDLQNTPSGGEHPAHIHINTAAEEGGIAVSLISVDGNNGMSTTIFSALDNGTSISYNELLDFDGYVNVHLSATDLNTIVAQGDIGQNDLTGTTKSYDLEERAVPGISGTVTFSERVNGEALAEIILSGTPPGGDHPAHIHENTALEGGGILFSFNPVNGDTGVSLTNVAAFDDGSTLTYSDIEGLDAYVNVHLSASELGTIVAQGDIGQNELTGNVESYTLDTADVPGISGVAEFAERVNGSTLVTITLNGTPAGGSHPAHIHQNDAATGGDIIVGLSPVDGDTGISKTQVTQLVGGSAVSFNDFLDINAYINVHLSDADLATIVAQGNIGSNVGNSNNSAINYDVTNSGASAYIFNGNGLSNSNNPDLTLTKGQTYTFTIDSPGHPFYINSVQGTGTGNTFNNGITNNGAVSGTITFTVPSDAPNTLFYNCEFHGSMTGTFTIVD